MIVDEENDTLIFSSGRKEYANCCIIGIGPDLSISEGYDGGFGSALTPDERCELADYMISLWTRFRQHIRPDLPEIPTQSTTSAIMGFPDED